MKIQVAVDREVQLDKESSMTMDMDRTDSVDKKVRLP
jgi:hypothetical protein